jgi:hypothetical protein
MAARAWIVAVMNDGADRVHVVTGCGFDGVYGTAGSPHGADAKFGLSWHASRRPWEERQPAAR